MLNVSTFAAPVVFQGRRHGLPLLFQAGRPRRHDPGPLPRDQPEAASGAGGHTLEEHNAQGMQCIQWWKFLRDCTTTLFHHDFMFDYAHIRIFGQM